MSDCVCMYVSVCVYAVLITHFRALRVAFRWMAAGPGCCRRIACLVSGFGIYPD